MGEMAKAEEIDLHHIDRRKGLRKARAIEQRVNPAADGSHDSVDGGRIAQIEDVESRHRDRRQADIGPMTSAPCATSSRATASPMPE